MLTSNWFHLASHWCTTCMCVRPDDLLEANVTFATADAFVRMPPVCPTVYATYSFEREKLHMLTSWVPRGGLAVVYE
jgi:hypothetical protein